MESAALNAKTDIAEIDGKKIAYRQFGNGNPLIFTNRFRGVLDTWDPLFLDRLAEKNTIVIFDYPGIGSSEGELPLSIMEVAATAPQLADFLNIEKFNLLGWSYGGLVAQTVMFGFPERILKTILIGTNPPGSGEVSIEPAFIERALKDHNDLEDEYVLFFEPSSDASRRAAKLSHERIAERLDKNLIPSGQDLLKRYFAGGAMFREDAAGFRERYKTLKTPVLIISGDHDISFATENWFPLLRNAPSIRHLIFNDAGHAPHHQQPEFSAEVINLFLEQ